MSAPRFVGYHLAVSLGLCFCSHLLQEEASLRMAEQDLDLWVQQNVIMSDFTPPFLQESSSAWLALRSISLAQFLVLWPPEQCQTLVHLMEWTVNLLLLLKVG